MRIEYTDSNGQFRVVFVPAWWTEADITNIYGPDWLYHDENDQAIAPCK